MAENNPELQAKLRELDHELEEGDITQKGCVCAANIVGLQPLLGRILADRCANSIAATKSAERFCYPSFSAPRKHSSSRMNCASTA